MCMDANLLTSSTTPLSEPFGSLAKLHYILFQISKHRGLTAELPRLKHDDAHLQGIGAERIRMLKA